MTLIFDLDGTILDTYPLLKVTLNEVFQAHFPEHANDEALIQSFFGPPLLTSFRKLAKDETEAEAMVTEYRRLFNQYHFDWIRLFPGVLETLDTLREKHHLAVCSNKIRRAIFDELRYCEIDDWFDWVVGHDDVEHAKPHPEGLLKIMVQSQEPCIFIGDTLGDFEAARAAHIPFVGVTWALHNEEDFKKYGESYVIHHINELIQLIKEFE